MDTADFHLSTQVNSDRTIIRRSTRQDFMLTHPYSTEGTFENHQKGLSTEEEVKGMTLYTPAALFRLGNKASEVAYELFLDKGCLSAYASIFDIENGNLAALKAFVQAPLGIFIGRLMKDPTREAFATFFSHS